MTDTITLPRSVVEQALDALKIGHESARDCAETFHIEMAGYKQQRHEALDAEVKQISDAIGALRAALDQPQDHPEQRLDMVPAGWKLVPVEPTDEMLRSSCGCESPAMFRESLRRETDGRLTAEMVEKIIRRHLASYRAMLAAAPQPPALEQPQVEQEPVAHSIVAGALFDFMGWLTSRRERLVLSSTDNAAPVADAIKDFAKMRSLSISDAQVQKWQEHLSAPQPPRQPLTDKVIQELAEEGVFHANIFEIVRRIEEEHGIFKLRAGIGGEA